MDRFDILPAMTARPARFHLVLVAVLGLCGCGEPKRGNADQDEKAASSNPLPVRDGGLDSPRPESNRNKAEEAEPQRPRDTVEPLRPASGSLADEEGREVGYGADELRQEPGTGRLILRGRAWLRIDDSLLDGRRDPNSELILQAKPFRVLHQAGSFESSTLLGLTE